MLDQLLFFTLEALDRFLQIPNLLELVVFGQSLGLDASSRHRRGPHAERAEREARELEELLDAMSNGDADVADRHGITFADVARHTSYATFLFERRKALLSRGPMKVAA